MNKNELREFYKNVRKKIKNKEVLDCSTLLIYVSFNDEVDTINIIKYFLGKRKLLYQK